MSDSAVAAVDSISREQCIESLLHDEEISDLILIGSDNVRVIANRGFLAAKSLIFRKMLFGNFSEASKDEIHIGYTGAVLRLIVEYIYTERCVVPLLSSSTNDEQPLVLSREDTFTVAELVGAATYFELGTLHTKAVSILRDTFKKTPSLCVDYYCCTTSQESTTEDDVTMPWIEELALAAIRSDPNVLLMSKSLREMTKSKMEVILRDRSLQATEFTLFKILLSWSSWQDQENDDASSDVVVSPPPPPPLLVSRRSDADRLSYYLSLHHIHPVDLSDTVAPSGIVSQDRIYDAFKMQALQAADNGIIPYKRVRCPLWSKSMDTVCVATNGHYIAETLSCPILRTGIHKWCIRVEEVCDRMLLGVISTEHEIKYNGWIGYQNGTWMYCCDGFFYYAPSEYEYVNRVFAKGSELHFTLDLTPERGGTLSASIDDDHASVELTTNMLSDKVGFLPAVNLKAPGKLRFLGFE